MLRLSGTTTCTQVTYPGGPAGAPVVVVVGGAAVVVGGAPVVVVGAVGAVGSVGAMPALPMVQETMWGHTNNNIRATVAQSL